MAHEITILLQFSFFILFALLGTVLSMRLRQPYVVGLLIFGMLAGPHVLGIVGDQELIATFSELGAILLLFAVGIEFSISRLLRSGFRAVFITAFKMSVLFFFGYESALYFGLDLTTSLVVGAMLSITSTSILFKVVAQKGMVKNPTMPLLFSMLIVEDVAAVAALTFFSTLGHGAPTYEEKFISVLISLGLLGVFYLLVRRPAARAILRLTSSLSEEVMIFVSFSLCLAMSMVAGFFGLSPAIGAFLAGSIISTLPNAKRIEKTIKPLLLMFASLFFLSLGMQIEPEVVAANFGFAAFITLLFVAVCFAAVFVLLRLTGSDVRNSLFGSSAMVVLGEFSLLIASAYTGQYSSLLIAAGSFGVIATAVISSSLLDRQQLLFELEQRHVPQGMRRVAGPLSLYMSGIIRDFSPNGGFWKISRICWDCISRKLAKIAVIALLVFLSRFAIGFLGMASGAAAAQLRAAILLLGMLPIIYLLFGILLDLKPVLDSLSRTIARHRKDAKPESVILRDIALAGFFLLASLSLPDLVAHLQLPSFFSWSDEIFFLLSLVFIWDVIGHARELHRRRNGKK